MAFYRIDIHRASVSELTGPEFFSLARRTFAFEGVMAARLHEEDQQATPRRAAPQRQVTAGSHHEGGAQVVSLDHFRGLFPGLVSHGEGR